MVTFLELSSSVVSGPSRWRQLAQPCQWFSQFECSECQFHFQDSCQDLLVERDHLTWRLQIECKLKLRRGSGMQWKDKLQLPRFLSNCCSYWSQWAPRLACCCCWEWLLLFSLRTLSAGWLIAALPEEADAGSDMFSWSFESLVRFSTSCASFLPDHQFLKPPNTLLILFKCFWVVFMSWLTWSSLCSTLLSCSPWRTNS